MSVCAVERDCKCCTPFIQHFHLTLPPQEFVAALILIVSFYEARKSDVFNGHDLEYIQLGIHNLRARESRIMMSGRSVDILLQLIRSAGLPMDEAFMRSQMLLVGVCLSSYGVCLTPHCSRSSPCDLSLVQTASVVYTTRKSCAATSAAAMLTGRKTLKALETLKTFKTPKPSPNPFKRSSRSSFHHSTTPPIGPIQHRVLRRRGFRLARLTAIAG